MEGKIFDSAIIIIAWTIIVVYINYNKINNNEIKHYKTTVYANFIMIFAYILAILDPINQEKFVIMGIANQFHEINSFITMKSTTALLIICSIGIIVNGIIAVDCIKKIKLSKTK